MESISHQGVSEDSTLTVNLSRRVAFVTGAGRNIGRAVALRLGLSGAAVACTWQSDEAAAEATCQAIVDGGGRALAFHLDLKDPASVRESAARAARELGPIAILVNVAAIRPRHDVEEVTLEEWDDVIAVNLRAPFLLSQAVLPEMRRQGFGRIIFFGGLNAGYWGGAPHVGATKLGVVGVARSLAKQAGPWGITVNTVVPGAIISPQRAPGGFDAYHGHSNAEMEQRKESRVRFIPAGRLGTGADIASACLFLASTDASYVTGQEIFVTGGAFPLVNV